MEILLLPFKLFAFNPIAVFIAAAFLAIPCFIKRYSRSARIVAGISAGIWLIYGFEEVYMTSWRSPTGDMAIRIDLILFGPWLLVVALVGLGAIVFGLKRRT